MIRSMTGYGEAEQDVGAGRMRVEIRTVNHRFFNAQIRTPPGFERLDGEIQSWLRAHVSRGHVSYSLSMAGPGRGPERPLPELDLERALHYRDLLLHLQAETGMPGGPDLAMLARFGDVFRAPEATRDEPAVELDVLRDVTDRAARALVAMREAEGARLKRDLEGRLDAMEGELSAVARRAPERLLAERDRLRAAITELGGEEAVDADRLAREVAYLAERWDISEEIVRFRAHVQAFREALEGEAAESVGKRLGFLVQEMHREATTIGSKANDATIAHASVSLREQIERLREQLENVE